MALVQSVGQRRSVQYANEAAQELGVAAGQPVATALALCADLLLLEHDPATASQALHEAAMAALRFTPAVSIDAHGLRLEISASVRLFGGQRSLIRQLRATQTSLGLAAAFGLAPTARAAWLLARAGTPGRLCTCSAENLEASLDPLPVYLLEDAASHLPLLDGIGCQTLGQLRRLPRGGLARRFGSALLDQLDQAYGQMADPQHWVVAPDHFEARIELMARSESIETLLFAAQRLMAQLAGWLCARQAATSHLILTLYHERWRTAETGRTVVQIGLSQPSRDPEHLLGLVRERLGRLALAAPVEELSLAASDLCPSAPANQELFPTAQSTALTLNRLTEKLRARLGAQAIRHVLAVADHRPEKAWKENGTATPPRPATTSAARPVWLMRHPQALSLQGPRPVYGTSLRFLAGPERIEAGWWDDALVARDYYVAENGFGQLLWIYRERQTHEGRNPWFLHGLFG